MTDSNGTDVNGHIYQTNLTNHGVLIGATGGVLSSTAVGSTGQVLQANSAADPTYSTATFPSTATGTGTILRADGTNWVATTATYPATTTAFDLLCSTATNVVGQITAGTTGQVLTGVTGAVPAFSATPSVTSVTFPSAGGSGTPTSDALGFYEEGTFTPTLDGAVSGTTTYTKQFGHYTKIGNIVHCDIEITITAATGTGTATIGALPFTIKNQDGASNYLPGGAVYISGSWAWPASKTYLVPIGVQNTTTLFIFGCQSNAAAVALSMTNAALVIAISITYQV